MSCQLCACMKLLLILLSAMMTLTVQDKRTVKAEGTWPNDMEATYYNTGNKGSVTSKDTATLRVSGLDGVQVEQVRILMRSNKSAGAGVITMIADGQQLYRKEGTYKDWFGAYDNTNYQPIGWEGKQTVNTLEVQVVGTVNSLHIEKYEITWTQAQAQEYTVTLMKGDEQIETLSGKTVTLPQWEDQGNWTHIGWTEEAFDQKEGSAAAVSCGPYKPTKDVTVWAVYTYQQSLEDLIATELHSGYYIYANLTDMMGMSGGVKNGVVGSESVNESSFYWVEFSEDMTTATIQVSEVEYIGFSGKTLTSAESNWKVYHEGTKTAFYTEYGSDIYILLPGLWNETSNEYVTKLWDGDLETAPTALIELQQPGTPVLTCFPEYGLGTENVEWQGEGREVVIPFGIYNLKIINGRKYLELR